MEENMRYSVLMSVYAKEHAEYLCESMDSIFAQTVLPSEFLLMCDGPLTSELEEVIAEKQEQYPNLLRLVRLPECKGLGNALAIGVKECTYELIARMDSDDISDPDRCRRQLEVFGKQKVDIVGSNIVEFEDQPENEMATRSVPETAEEIYNFAKRRNPFNHPSVMYRKSAVLAAGNYLDCKGFEDYYLWARMLHHGATGYNIQLPLVHMRTAAGMYERRGTFAYACLAWHARWNIHKDGYNSFMDFMISSSGQLVVSILPLGLRTAVYCRLLRKKDTK